MTKLNNELVPGQKVKLVDHLDYEDILLYGHECVGEELEIKAVFMDGSTEVCAVNLNGINYCFASRILEAIKTEAEKRREKLQEQLIRDSRYCGNGFADHINPTFARHIIDAGWIKPKPLTDDVIERLIDKHQNECETLCSFEFARMIEAYIHGETL